MLHVSVGLGQAFGTAIVRAIGDGGGIGGGGDGGGNLTPSRAASTVLGKDYLELGWDNVCSSIRVGSDGEWY